MVPEKLSTKEILTNNMARTIPPQLGQAVVLLHDIRSMHNVGAAFRCADAFGIEKLLLGGVTPTPPRPEITKTAIGAEQHVNWQRVEDTQEKIQALQACDYQLIGMEQTKSSIPLPDFAAPSHKKLCLVFGNEVTGLNDALLPYIDTFVEIPQYGHKHSLNVSVTVGIGLYAFLQKYW